MYQKDYILRMIEMMADLIAGILPKSHYLLTKYQTNPNYYET